MKNKWFKSGWLSLSLLLLCLSLLTACASSPTVPAIPPAFTAPVTSTVAPTFTANPQVNSPIATPTVPPTLQATATPAPTATATITPVLLSGKLVHDWQTSPDSDLFARMRNLSGVAVDSKGQVYIINNLIGQILKYDSAGNLLADLSRPDQPPLPSKITDASATNRVGYPEAIAVDRQDTVYVLDGFSYGIHRFDSSGQYLGQFRAVADGGTGGVGGLAVDETGVVYVLDGGRVRKFDTTGKFIGEWGNPTGQTAPESEDGKFNLPTAVAADGKGHIYVADTGNHRIQKFDLNDKFLLKFGTQGQGDGQFSDNLGAMAFDTQGNLYVPDRLNHRVEKFDSQGHFLASFGSKGSGKGQFNLPVGVAVVRQDQLYVADYGNERVQKLDAAGRWLASFGRQDQGDGKLSWSVAAGVDATGNLYVADAFPVAVQKFDSQGRFLLRWELPAKDTKGYSAGDPISMALDPAGNVYVGVSTTRRVYKYDSQGHLLFEWGQEGSGPGQFNSIFGLAVDRHNQVWIADTGNYRLQKFDDQGHFISELDFNFFKAATGTDERYKDAPLGVAFDDQDQLYVVFGPFVRKFDSQGNFLLKWGDPEAPNGDGLFVLPSNAFVDGRGFIYVQEQGDFHGAGSRIQKFDNQGHLQFTWQSLLHLPMDPYITVVPPGRFTRFTAMAVDRAGNIYMANSMLGRVDKYLQK